MPNTRCGSCFFRPITTPNHRSSQHCSPPQLLSSSVGWVICRDSATRLATQLKAVGSLREVKLRQFPRNAGLELLHSRKTWTRISLPSDSQTVARASAFAGVNRSDFALHFDELRKPEHLSPWLLNPHLTELNLHLADSAFASGCFDDLQLCKTLTSLVRCTAALTKGWRCLG
jgi:hypothetical protein